MKKLVMSELLNGKTLDLLLRARQNEVNWFVNSLSQMTKFAKPVNVKDELLKLTNNMISRMLISERCSDEETEASDMTNLTLFLFLLKNLFIAGTDTSALTIEWGLAELINHPIIMEKVVEEINRVVGQDRQSEESDVPNLPYLQAVVKETLIIPRTSTEDCTVGGYHIPAKTTVLLTCGRSRELDRSTDI
ncbi:3,9-dihydroxypterocarpan 6A-monooxygenase-like [Bidens hawaiensis]|uniref:3,9-dihydroxypterocarpan 6A-monooxygenase-like n=1 Tax=Bidens hawaiensis TaxID=980011 RepID=UPI00404AF104